MGCEQALEASRGNSSVTYFFKQINEITRTRCYRGGNYIKTGSSPAQVDCNETDKMLKRSEVEADGMLEMCVGGQDRCRGDDILRMV